MGPAQYPQYTRADFGPEAVGGSLNPHTLHEPKRQTLREGKVQQKKEKNEGKKKEKRKEKKKEKKRKKRRGDETKPLLSMSEMR